MEVPLKPKTVPLSAETVLWFEFLLKPELLITHLEKKGATPNPSPAELVEKFLAISPESQLQSFIPPNTDANVPETANDENNSICNKFGRKQIALKILSINVVSHLKWDLTLIERNWNFQKQIQLMDDLCTITSGQSVTIPLSLPSVVGPLGNEAAYQFALFVYHRWILRVYKMFKDLIVKKTAFTLNNPPGTPLPADMILTYRDELFMTYMDPEPQSSVKFLLDLCSNAETQMSILTLTSIVPLTANTEHSAKSFQLNKTVSVAELHTQVHFDLCQYFLYNNSNELATKHAVLCRDNLRLLQKEYGEEAPKYLICDATETELEGILLACGVSEMQFGLVQQMNVSIMNRYEGLLTILREDNVSKEIPFVQRKVLELDIEGGLICYPYVTADLEKSVVALNTIRCIVDTDSILTGSDFLDKYGSEDDFLIFSNHIVDYLKGSSGDERNKIKHYFNRSILIKEKLTPKIEAELNRLDIFTADELYSQSKTVIDATHLPAIATQSDWTPINPSKSVRIETGSLERQLISCTDTNVLRQLLVKLMAANPRKPLWKINPSWNWSTLIPLSRGFIQDFAYILLGKAREAASKHDFEMAVNMLQKLREETQRQEYVNVNELGKLGVLVDWEMLLVQIEQVLYDWPRQNSELADLIPKCKQCLATVLNQEEGPVPRTQLMENCAFLLLNVNEFNMALVPERRNLILQLTGQFGTLLSDLDSYRSGSKKTQPYVFDLLTDMFDTGTKRTTAIPTVFIPFVRKIRDGTLFAVVIAALVQIHNTLTDELNLEIGSDILFPFSGCTNQNNTYNVRLVAEVLSLTLKQALAYYPQHVAFLKQLADLEFANGNNETAMKYYVNAVVTGTEYCTLPLGRPLLDDVLLRRMIKCCSNMGCHMQAAVLYQFMDEIDYGTAFKCLSEKSINFTDAMDAYYPCIWDVTMLEFIVNMHNKKGEHARKQQAIAYMSQLELNANNNDEIKREAAAVRKTKFMRTLAKQYMV